MLIMLLFSVKSDIIKETKKKTQAGLYLPV